MNSTTTSSTFGSNHDLAKIFAGANTAKSKSGLSSAFLPWGATIESRKAIEASGASTATIVAPDEDLVWGEGFEIAPTTTTSVTDPVSQTSPITTVSTGVPSIFGATPAKAIFSPGVPPLYVAPVADEVIADAPLDQDPLLLLPAPSGEPISTVGENEKVPVVKDPTALTQVPSVPKQRVGLFGGGPSAAATISQAGNAVNALAKTPNRNGQFTPTTPSTPSSSNFTQRPVKKNALSSLWEKLSGKGKKTENKQANTPKVSSRVAAPVTRNLSEDSPSNPENGVNGTSQLFSPNPAPESVGKLSQWTQTSPTFGK